MKLSWPVLLMIAGSLQLIIVAFYSALSRAKFPKKGLRRSERMLIVSSAIAALASLTLIDVRTLWRPRAAVSQAYATAAPSQRIVRKHRSRDGRIRPGAAVLLYKSSRCAVKVLNGSVEVVE